MQALAPGLHLIHKPAGVSSHARVEQLRAGRERMCHGGALDPFAEGLLLVLVGEATRLFPFLHAVPKVYAVGVRWGVETDTGDPGGQVIFRGDTEALRVETLTTALAAQVGWREQVPPATSNKRVDGERAYVRVHRGETVDLPPSRVLLDQASWTGHDLPRRSDLELHTSGGYYVRALVRDLGRELGVGAHVDRLERLAIGPWHDPGPEKSVRIQGNGLLPWCPRAQLSRPERESLAVGRRLLPRTVEPPSVPVSARFPTPPVRLCHDGRLWGLAEARADGLQVVLVLRRPL